MRKGELAKLYLPQMSMHSATNTLCEWININQELYFKLLATGYKKTQRFFTPAQVKLLYEYLGEP